MVCLQSSSDAAYTLCCKLYCLYAFLVKYWHCHGPFLTSLLASLASWAPQVLLPPSRACYPAAALGGASLGKLLQKRGEDESGEDSDMAQGQK